MLTPKSWTKKPEEGWDPTNKTSPSLPSGLYTVREVNFLPAFFPIELLSDDIIHFDSSVAADIYKEAEKFWTLKDKYKAFGILHRRGYLLHGPQGTGKSSIVYELVTQVIEKQEGVAFYLNTDPTLFAEGLQMFRKTEPERPVICIYEDINDLMKKYGDEDILSLLDGEMQLNNVINIATTNDIKALEPRIRTRPRRFDRLHWIGYPDARTREDYFKTKLLLTSDELEAWVTESDGMVFAGMAELIVAVKCFGNSLKEAAATIKNMNNPYD